MKEARLLQTSRLRNRTRLMKKAIPSTSPVHPQHIPSKKRKLKEGSNLPRGAQYMKNVRMKRVEVYPAIRCLLPICPNLHIKKAHGYQYRVTPKRVCRYCLCSAGGPEMGKGALPVYWLTQWKKNGTTQFDVRFRQRTGIYFLQRCTLDIDVNGESVNSKTAV